MRTKWSYLLVMLLALAVALGSAWAEKAGAEGEQPQLELWASYREPYFILDENLNGDSRLLSVGVERYDELKQTLGGEPRWTIEPLDEEPYEEYWEDRGREVVMEMVRDENASLADCAVRYRVTCEWQGLRASKEIELNFRSLPAGLPDGVDGLPQTLTMRVGDSFYLTDICTPHMNPVSWAQSAAGFVPDIHIFAEMLGADVDFMSTIPEDLDDRVEFDGVGCFRHDVLRPGRYKMHVMLYCANSVKEMGSFRLDVMDENGNIPGPVLTMHLDTREPYYIIGDDRGDWAFLSAFIENYDAMAEMLGGEPEWILESAPDMPFRYHADVTPGGRDFMLVKDEVIDEPCTGKFVVRCRWGGLETAEEKTVRLDRLPVDFPQIVSLPDKITIKTGRLLSLEAGFSPKNWSATNYGFTGNMYCHVMNYTLTEEYDDALEWCDAAERAGEHTLVRRAGRPGHYWLDVRYSMSNLSIVSDKRIELIITDAEGNVPDDDWGMRLYFGKTEPFYIINSEHVNDGLLSGYIEGYYALRELLGGEPEWSVEIVDGMEIPFKIQTPDDRTHLMLTCDEIREPGETAFRVTCRWGDMESTETITVRFDRLPVIPEIAEVPEKIELMVGDLLEMRVGMSSDEWEEYGFYSWAFADAVDYMTNAWVDALEWCDESEHTDPFTFVRRVVQPGRYKLRVSYIIGNARIYTDKTVELLVADENGVVPSAGLRLWFDKKEPYYIIGEEGNTLVLGCYIEGYDEIREMIGGEPQWSLEGASGLSFPFRAQSLDEGRAFFIDREAMIGKPGETTFTVRCQWGEFEAEEEITVRFDTLPCVPEITNVSGALDLTVGDLLELRVDLSNDEWKDYGFRGHLRVEAFSKATGDWVDALDWCDESEHADEYTTIRRVKEPGRYRLELVYEIANVEIRLPYRLELVVADENGNVPDEAPLKLYGDYREPYYILDDQDGAFDSRLLSVWVEGYDELRETLAGEPRWSLKALDAEPYKSTWEDRGREVCLEMVPGDQKVTAPCEVRYEVICEWDGLAVSKVFALRFDFLPGGLPTGMTGLPTSPVRTSTDKTFYLTDFCAPHMLPLNWAAEGFVPDVHMAARRVGEEDFDWDALVENLDYRKEFDGIGCFLHETPKPGVYNVNISLYCANVIHDVGSFPLYVTDENGMLPHDAAPAVAASKTMKLPAGLKMIGDYAFAGDASEAIICGGKVKSIGDHAFANSALRVITLPDSVTSISDTAFEGCDHLEGIICSANSYAAQYAHAHGIFTYEK